MCRITADAPRSCSLEGCALWVSLEIRPPHSYHQSGFQEKKVWPSHSSPLKLVMVPMHVRMKSQEFSWQAEASLTGLCLTAVFSHIAGTITSIWVVIRGLQEKTIIYVLSIYLSGFKWVMAILFLVWLLIPIFIHIILLWALSLLRQSASSFKILLVSVY